MYFNQRRVKIVASDDYGLNATVRGAGRTYEVQIDWFDSEHSGILTASCHCPTYHAGRLCKHIWATLLTADQQGIGKRVAGTGPLQVFLESSGDSESESDLQVGGGPAAEKVSWRSQFQSVRRTLGEHHEIHTDQDPRRFVHYRINVLKSLSKEQLVVDLYHRSGRSADSALRPLSLGERELSRLLDPTDHDFLSVLLAATPPKAGEGKPSLAGLGLEKNDGYLSGVVPPVLYDTLVPRLCDTGRFGWVQGIEEASVEHHELQWQEGDPWEFVLQVERKEDESRPLTRISGRLEREAELCDISDPLLLLDGVVVFRDGVGRLETGEHFPWIAQLRRDSEIEIPESEIDAMLEDLWSMPSLPPLDIPIQWQLDEFMVEPTPGVSFSTSGSDTLPSLDAEIWFDYDGFLVDDAYERRTGGLERIVDRPNGRLIFRDRERENAAFLEVEEAGLTLVERDDAAADQAAVRYRVSLRTFPVVAQTLIERGWLVEAEGQRLRQVSHNQLSLSVSSNVDWFELEGDVEFGDTTASLPALLSAIHKGEYFVRLDDGTHGLLPEEWIERYASLAANTATSRHDGDAVYFLPSQTLLLDSLLSEESVEIDRDFEKIRGRLQAFDRVEPIQEPRGFKGDLRRYQQEGLGWLKFLKDHGFGGCLADDMGLGKTVQVLALLQMRRIRPIQSWERLPSIIVVPRSLVHNWIEEAGRFTPKLRLLNYTGPGREEYQGSFDDYDVIVTTYGTLRRDVEQLKEIEFDYAILDEAQAIKNSSSQAAKACRQLMAQHRLALTGTPVENHLGELWSLFEFLNPGMLGQAVLKDLEGTPTDSEALATVSAALQPFIFRRTKEEVLDDLPEKTELTLYCELEGEQLEMYNQLREYYRISLNERIEQVGLRKSKIQVLEALLRLRQAACHPGLIDEERVGDASAKLDNLLKYLEEVLDEGHKALVFSQFTSLLSILRTQLDDRGVVYEYLDGRTRKRQEKVERFQNDEDCRLFLISLKAGGVGLNLTAADYVFILDPWWNPAVEAQAVDRAHRIGQTRPVFAYRLISRGTVEEKIMELQGSKKQLADAILSADKSLIGELSADDLKVLLS
ncbi:MAG: DEAD/DEAH box helicase [Acidobacteriota bacterium]